MTGSVSIWGSLPASLHARMHAATVQKNEGDRVRVVVLAAVCRAFARACDREWASERVGE